MVMKPFTAYEYLGVTTEIWNDKDDKLFKF